MKKLSIILAMSAVVLGMTSCGQLEDPKYHAPNAVDFTINTPALQDQQLILSDEMTDPSTFNLFCSQPDYGYSAICKYSALVSLNKDAKDEDWLPLTNQNPTQAIMAIKTFDLACAITKLQGYTGEDGQKELWEADAANAATRPVYFKAVCEIEGIDGSRVVSSNYVSYNAVHPTYAVLMPAWIYICGNVKNPTTGAEQSFLAPAAANIADYKANFALFEPTGMEGDKLFVGVFQIGPKADVTEPNLGNPDDAAQFRFFTDLVGWSPDCSLGSNDADFFCQPITANLEGEKVYNGEIVDHGLGNWGIHTAAGQICTIVVDSQALRIYVKEGKWDVTFSGREPQFK